MSALMTQAMIVDKYGIRLPVEKLAEILCVTKPSVYNQLSAGTFPIPTYVDQGRRNISAAAWALFLLATGQHPGFIAATHPDTSGPGYSNGQHPAPL